MCISVRLRSKEEQKRVGGVGLPSAVRLSEPLRQLLGRGVGLYGVYGVSGLVLDALFSLRVIGVPFGSHHKSCVGRRGRHGDV